MSPEQLQINWLTVFFLFISLADLTCEFRRLEDNISHKSSQKLALTSFCPDNHVKLQHRLAHEQFQIDWLTVFIFIHNYGRSNVRIP